MLDARAAARPVTYVNAAFETFFGYAADDALGRPLAALLFRGDEPLVHRLLAEPTRAGSSGRGERWRVRMSISLGAVHSAEGELTTGWSPSPTGEVEQLRWSSGCAARPA